MLQNYIVKVRDAKSPAVQKALTESGIEVISVQQVFKEEESSDAEASETDTSE